MVQQPSYISFDNKGRETFLSQIGNFTPGERELFHRLCRAWESEINYNRLIASATNENANAKTDLERLMSRLRNEGIGLICTTIKEGNRHPHVLVLCEKNEKRFFEKLVDEFLMDAIEDPAHQLPGLNYLRSQGVQVPAEYLDPIGFDQAAALTSDKEAPASVQGTLFALTVGSDETYLFSREGVRKFASAALIKAQFFFQNSNLLAAGAALLNSSLIEMKKNIASRIPTFWIGLTNEIVSKRKQLEAHRKIAIPPGFFPLMYFLNQLVQEQVEYNKRSKQLDEERKLDLQTLAEEVRRTPGGVMGDEAFGLVVQRFKEKYGEKIEEFKKEFEERFLVASARSNLSTILHIEKSYIHSDNLHSLFLSRINEIVPELQKIYVALMVLYIKNGGRLDDPTFTSPAALEDDIAEKVKNEDPLLFQLLQRPQAIAEAIINSSKKSNRVRSAEDMKLVLASFFYPDQVKFKELAIIFAVDLREIYQHAFLRLSLFRQVIMKITGKHESFYRQFTDHVQKLYNAISKRSGTGTGPGNSPDRDEQGAGGEDRRSPGGRTSARNPQRAERKSKKPGAATPQATKKPKLYSDSEQESAWSQFSKTLKK